LDERKESVLGGVGSGMEEEKKMTGGMKAVGPGAIGKNGQPLYVDSDEGEEGTARDIERIWISSDDEEDEHLGSSSSSAPGTPDKNQTGESVEREASLDVVETGDSREERQ